MASYRIDTTQGMLYAWAILLIVVALLLAALDFYDYGRWALWLALGCFIGSKFFRIVEVCFFSHGMSFISKIYLVVVNTALLGGAAYILIDLLSKHLGI